MEFDVNKAIKYFQDVITQTIARHNPRKQLSFSEKTPN